MDDLISRADRLTRLFKRRSFVIDSPGLRSARLPDGRVQLHAAISPAVVQRNSFQRTLTIDHTKVPATQTDFPVLVSLLNGTLATITNGGHVANSLGYDIGFFSDSAGSTPLKWEIERYNATTGELIAWVKIASVSSLTDTVFYMRYGDASIITDQSDPVNVWTNSYIAAYHLANGTVLQLTDSKGGFTLTNTNTVTPTTGQIDGAATFVSATNQRLANTVGTMNPGAAFTLSAWINATSFPNAANVVIALEGATNYKIISVTSAGKLSCNVLYGAANAGLTGTTTLSAGTWYYLTLVGDVTGITGYLNAVSEGTTANPGGGFPSTGSIYIGSEPLNPTLRWNGKIDEVRESSVVRSATWITTEYNNQSSPGTFVTLGPET